MIRFGPAGWDYPDWSGIVYPKPRRRGFDPLAWLARYFDVVEVNSTFYRPALGSVARAWCRRVDGNPDFRFTAKLWRRFTHERDTAFTAEDVRLAREPLDVLAEEKRLGAVLMQFPWSFRRDEQSREWLADVTRALGGLPLVLEVRHESWNVPELYEGLLEQGVGFVNIDQPHFGHSIRPSSRATGPVGYVRIHGRNYRDWFRKDAGRDARYDYLYTADELAPWAERVKALADEAEDVYVVANNHVRGQAPVNALMLESMLGARKVEAPPQLFERYQGVLEAYAEPREGGGEQMRTWPQ
jgi:uncharacterized protein YecE (DUF72 family)